MNLERKALADLFARLYELGVTTSATDLACMHCDTTGKASGRSAPNCYECDGEGYHVPDCDEVIAVLGEMMNVATPGVSMADVLDAAKKAGVY